MVLRQRGLALRHLDRRDAQAPDVRLRIIPGLANDLRRHPERRADERVPERVAERRGDAKVGELDAAGGAEEDVGGLDVAVDHALAVQVVERQQELAADNGDVGLGEDTGLEQVEAGAAGEVLHDDPQLVALDERAIVARDILGITLGKVGNLLLDLGDVVVRVFKIC